MPHKAYPLWQVGNRQQIGALRSIPVSEPLNHPSRPRLAYVPASPASLLLRCGGHCGVGGCSSVSHREFETAPRCQAGCQLTLALRPRPSVDADVIDLFLLSYQ